MIFAVNQMLKGQVTMFYWLRMLLFQFVIFKISWERRRSVSSIYCT